MHLVRQFDKQYSLKGLIGLGSKKEDQKEKKNDLVVKCEINPLAGFEMELDYNNSLHTQQLQMSQYVKIDDNILKFDFDRRANSKNALTEDQIQKLQTELNRVHIKYLRYDQVHKKRMTLLNQKLAFAK